MFARLSVFLLVSSVISCCCSERPTPFIAWSDSDAFSSVRQRDVPSVADIVGQAKLDRLEILVIFRTDVLSFDDIVKFSGAYGEGDSSLEALQSQVSKAASSVWSGVHGSPASELVDILSEQLGMEPHYLRDWTKLPQTSGSPQLLLLDLPAAGEKEDFARQDAVIATVMGSIEQLGRPFAAFYTAGGSEESSVPVNLRSRRQTPSPSKVNSSLCWSKYENATAKTPCLLFCLPNITYQMRYIQNYSAYWNVEKDKPHNESLCWLNATVNESSMVCGKDVIPELELDLEYLLENCTRASAIPPTKKIKLTFPQGNITDVDFLPKFYWRMDLSYSNNSTGEVDLKRSHADPRLYRTFAVPRGVAYACNSSIYNSYTVNATSLIGFEGSVFQFLSVQVQPYNVTFTTSLSNNPFFSSTYNCEGYFTFPSWMGVFIVLLLLLILYLSTIFIFSMQTIDRFDDPRGQTINVENLH